MSGSEPQPGSNLAAGTDEAVQSLDQQQLQALLFNSFLNQQQRKRGKSDSYRRLSAIVALLHSLADRVEENGVLGLVASQVIELSGATGVAIALLQHGEMVCRASSGASAPDLGAPFSVQSGLSGECVRTGHTLLCRDTESDSRVNREATRALRARSMVLVPIRENDSVVGVLEMFAPHPDAFDAEDVATLELLAALIAYCRAYIAERAWRQALEMERSGVVQALEQITPALEAVLAARVSAPARDPATSASHLDSAALDLSRKSIQELVRTLGLYSRWARLNGTNRATG